MIYLGVDLARDTLTEGLVLRTQDVPADITAATTIGAAPVTLTTMAPGQNSTVTFTGTAGQRISTAFADATYGWCGFASALTAPGGTVLARSDCDFLAVVTLPTNGAYTVTVDPNDGSVGSVDVQVWLVPASVVGQVATDGTPQPVTFVAPDQTAQLTFDTGAEHRAVVAFDGSAVLGTATAAVRGPDNSPVCSVVLTTLTTGGCRIDETQAGTYHIDITPSGGLAGSLLVQVFTDLDEVTRTANLGDTVTAPVAVAGQVVEVSFHGDSGQHIGALFTLASPAAATLRGPDGAVLGSWSQDMLRDMALPATGTYSVVVSPKVGFVGDVTLRLFDVLATAPIAMTVDNAPVPVPLPQIGQRATLTFAGIAGSSVYLRVHSGPGRLAVTVRHNNQVVSTYALPPSGVAFFTPPQTGSYEVIAEPYQTNVGTWTFETYRYVSAPSLSSQVSGWTREPATTVSWTMGGATYYTQYAVVVDDQPDTIPTVLTHNDTSLTVSIPDGVAYVHVRAYNGFGVWGSASHLRLRGDRTAPVIAQLHSETHPDPSNVYTSRDYRLAWSGQDSGSGVTSYSGFCQPYGQ